MSNSNNKQPPDLTKSLPISDNTQAPSTTTQTVKKPDYVGINLVEMSSVKPPEKNDSLGIPGINQPNASTSTPINDPSRAFLLDCAKRRPNRGNQRRPSICKVSRIHRDLNDRSFTPQLVSIGPIHREDPKLQEFEWLKECYLHDLLNRCHNSTPKKTLEACLLMVNTLIPQIRESYDDGVIEKYDDVNLAWMMVMDGCFILEFCFKHNKRNLNFPNTMQALRIAMDLILLENQVPFVVLQDLFDCFAPYIFSEKGSVTLSQVLDTHLAPYIKLFREINLITDVDSDSTHVDSDSPPAHVLGYLHKLYHLEAAKSTEPKDAESLNRMMDAAFHSIVELDRSGMNIKRHQEDEWSMTIKFGQTNFWGKPALLMPILVIDDTTELILRNFIAYEQSFPQVGYYFTSYAHAMDMLIDSKEDIAKLVESKVLVNRLGSKQEAANMINKICKNMFVKGFYYTNEFKRMDEYYNGIWPNTIARLRRVYFSNPWSAIALVAAIILFGLTVVQTVYTIMAA